MHPKRRLKIAGSHSGQAEGGWAVSYADFLMVLLSFFIVFFSFDDKSPLKDVMLTLNEQTSAVAKTNPAVLAETDAGSALLKKMSALLPNSKVEMDGKQERIVLDLPNDIYRVGSFQVPIQALAQVLKPLEAYQKDISITILGHADSIGFHHDRTVVKDNLTLSSLRAAYASTHVQQILPQAQVWIQASDHSPRKSRSLSFVIEPRKGGSL